MKKEDYTLEYYNQNSKAFVESTVEIDMSHLYDCFTSYLPANARILDFGCGSGRDAKHLSERGFVVDAIDGSEALCAFAREHTGLPVRCMLFSELEDVARYEGIWACASILHVPSADLPDILARMSRALIPGGVIFTSFKYGTTEGEKNGRFFRMFDEESFCELLKKVPSLAIEKLWVTEDKRVELAGEQWLDTILIKSQ